jgi:hypothetical protein
MQITAEQQENIMGCDIHVYTEKQNSQGHWVNSDNWRPNEYYSPYDPDYQNESRWEHQSVYHGRNYRMFSALAGVRGGSWSDEPQFDEPRGLPDDVSDLVRSESDRWDCDGHSHSYATLAELMNWVEQQSIIEYSVWVKPEQADRYHQTGEFPDDYFWDQVPGTVHVTWSQPYDVLDPLLTQLIAHAKDLFWIHNESVIKPEHAEKFRIVFWFDN